MGKGSNRRQCLVSSEEEDLRWKLFRGEITREQFDKEMEKLKGEVK